MADNYHRPVMLDEVLSGLALKTGGIYVDATVGGGGHARPVADAIGLGGVVVGIDRDPEALVETEATVSGTAARIVLVNAPFDEIKRVLSDVGLPIVDGVLFDLGISSHQVDEPTRGFTFRDLDSVLDMRMGQNEAIPTAADLLNSLSVGDLTQTFRDNADERWAARIAIFVEERRQKTPFRTARQLVETVKAAIPAAARSRDIHPATKAFQALRIAVNDEFGRLRRALRDAVDSLGPEGRLVVISYHSGEDRIVKQIIGELAGKCVCPPQLPQCVCLAKTPTVQILTKKPVIPSALEVTDNPRARSAKLRIAAKL